MDYPDAVFIYQKDILPHMPAYTKITCQQGELILAQMDTVSFDKEDPHWKFEHAFDWARDNLHNPNQQVNLGILKRYVAHKIDTPEADLDADDMRRIVLADVNAAVSDARVLDRWNLFKQAFILHVPIGDLLTHE